MRLVIVASLVVSAMTSSSTFAQDTDGRRYIGNDLQTGAAQAVLVEGGVLAYTTQFLPVSVNGDLAGRDAETQTAAVLAHLDAALKLGESNLSRVVKLNVCVTTPEVVSAVRKSLSKRFKMEQPPAVSFVQSRLAREDALVAMDAVGVAFNRKRPSCDRFFSGELPGVLQFTQVASISNAPRIYISGQAEKGMTLGEATSKTLDTLRMTLDSLKLSRDHVAQVKCFLSSMSDVQAAKDAIAAFFGRHTPPCAFIEWQSSLPIEIELVVADMFTAKGIFDAEKSGEKPPHREPLEFITPPGMNASPVFCRVVRVNDPRTIFVSGLYSREVADGAGQVSDVFAQLQEILKFSGSDLRHLAKATYYVSDNDASTKLNELRPKLYDPQRPPAASKAQVLGVGMSNRSLTLDMIAVPTK